MRKKCSTFTFGDMLGPNLKKLFNCINTSIYLLKGTKLKKEIVIFHHKFSDSRNSILLAISELQY